MQSVRNFLFYFSPLAGAVIGGLLGYELHVFAWLPGALVGLGAGLAVSLVMLVLSIRARFKADPTLTRSNLEKAANRETGLK